VTSRAVSFLFGAGASMGSRNCQPTTPPLGEQLFAAIEEAGLLPELPDEIDALFRSERNFEVGMAAFAKRPYHNLQYYRLIRAMARYFARFKPAPGNCYITLFRELLQSSARFSIGSLNYENLVEHSLCTLGVPAAAVVRIISKPHGSCGFLPDLGRIQVQGGLIMGASVDLDIDCSRVTIDPDEINRWCIDPANECFAPAMSFYAQGKASKICPRFIEEHRRIWRRDVAQSDVCFVVGVACRPEDAHIWGPLETVRELIYVNPNDDRFAEWTKRTGHGAARHWPRAFEAAIPMIVDQARRRS
jgi:hypothetical protein